MPYHRFLISLLIAILVGTSCPFLAFPQDQDEFIPSRAIATIDAIKTRLDKGEISGDAINNSLAAVSDLLSRGRRCLESSEADLEHTVQALAAIGDKVAGESREIGRQRQSLEVRKAAFDRRLAECRLLIVDGEDLQERMVTIRRQTLADHVFAKQDNVVSLFEEMRASEGRWFLAAVEVLSANSGLERVSAAIMAGAILFILAGGLLGHWLRLRLQYVSARLAAGQITGRLVQAVLATVVRFAALLGGLCSLALYLRLTCAGLAVLPVGVQFVHGLVGWLAATLGVRTVLAPFPPAEPLLSIPPGPGRTVAKRFVGLAIVGLAMDFLELLQGARESAFILAHALSVILFGLVLLWVVQPLWRADGTPRSARIFVFLTGLGVPILIVAEGLGYRHLSLQMVHGLFAMVGGIFFFKVMALLLDDLFGGLAHGRYRWQQRVRAWLGLGDQEVAPAFIWLRFIATVLALCLVGLFLLRSWALPDAYFTTLVSWMVDGLQIGKFRFAPLRIVAGFVLLVLLWTLSRWFKSSLDQKWLAATPLSQSSREAVVTIVGYVGVIVAILVGLSVAGMDLSNLTIIAGALSVGIGFGMQNIVNNFVSGLILLFERPIKRDDRIVVGGTEGYVKRISVRSTIIHTLDGADVIVPNSELISSQVINMMLDDPRGRLIVPVGVGYGSDTALVGKLLLECALNHAEVIKDGSVLPPMVLFLEFGESSLNFELRCFIRNVDNRPLVHSDLNFAIDAAFRAHGIEIPFPQRDLRVREWPAARFGPEP